MRIRLMLIGAGLTFALGCSSTRSCVARNLEYMSEGEYEAECDPGWRARRTGKRCGPDHEVVILDGCRWVRSENGHKEVAKWAVEVYMPLDHDICDVRTQAGGLCFE